MGEDGTESKALIEREFIERRYFKVFSSGLVVNVGFDEHLGGMLTADIGLKTNKEGIYTFLASFDDWDYMLIVLAILARLQEFGVSPEAMEEATRDAYNAFIDIGMGERWYPPHVQGIEKGE